MYADTNLPRGYYVQKTGFRSMVAVGIYVRRISMGHIEHPALLPVLYRLIYQYLCRRVACRRIGGVGNGLRSQENTYFYQHMVMVGFADAHIAATDIKSNRLY